MPLETVLDKLRNIRLSSPEEKVPYITDEPKIPNFLTLPNDDAKAKYSTEGDHGQGYDFNEVLSRIKSIAEYLERLCLDNPSQNRLTRGVFRDNGKMVDPGLFCCYSDEQIGNKEKFKEEARANEYLWVEVEDLVRGIKRMIPAQTVFLSNLFEKEFGIRREAISTGAALGEMGTERAFNSGLLEAIERDASIYAYLSKREMPHIVKFDGRIRKLEEYLKRYNLDFFVLDATSDLAVPTIISVVIDRTGIGPAVDVGSASGFNYENAIYKSIMESIQCRRHARIFDGTNAPGGIPTENEIFSLEDRFVYWQPIDRIKDIGFWLQGSEIHYSCLGGQTNQRTTLEGLKGKGFNIFEADVTLPEVGQAGFETKKIIIPELHPLYLDERAKALYSKHYGEIKEDKSLKPHPLT